MPLPLSLYPYSVVARIAQDDASVSHAVTRARPSRWSERRGGGSPGAPWREAYLQKPFGVQVPVVGGFGQSAAVVHSFVQIIII